MPSSKLRVVLADANILINLINVDRLRLLTSLPGYEFVVLDQVLQEVTRHKQRNALMSALANKVLRLESITDIESFKLYAELKQFLGSGEAACLALACTAGFYIASDEKQKFRREARERLGSGRIINTPGIYVIAIRAGVVSV